MELGADGFGVRRMRKGKVPDDITCCFFSSEQIRFRTDRQKARTGNRRESRSLNIPA